jgi:hypothetical protein
MSLLVNSPKLPKNAATWDYHSFLGPFAMLFMQHYGLLNRQGWPLSGGPEATRSAGSYLLDEALDSSELLDKIKVKEDPLKER